MFTYLKWTQFILYKCPLMFWRKKLIKKLYFQSAETQAKAYWRTSEQEASDPCRAAGSETLARRKCCLVKVTESPSRTFPTSSFSSGTHSTKHPSSKVEKESSRWEPFWCRQIGPAGKTLWQIASLKKSNFSCLQLQPRRRRQQLNFFLKHFFNKKRKIPAKGRRREAVERGGRLDGSSGKSSVTNGASLWREAEVAVSAGSDENHCDFLLRATLA